MSFYGQVIYEFTKLFSKFKIGETILEAENIWDQVELTNDEWIVLAGNKDENDNKTISIKHNTPQETEINQASFLKFDDEPESDKNIEQLQYGDTIKTAAYQFDKRGHLTGTETNYYKLPTLDIKYGAEESDKISPSGNIISIEGDSNWIKIQKKDSDNKLKIVHSIPDLDDEEISKTSISAFGKKSPDNIEYTKQDFLDAIVNVDKKTDEDQLKMQQYLNDNNLLTNDETICVLSPGDLIESVIAMKDSNGHIIDVQPTYFKLPVSPTDLNFEDHTNRINDIEERLGEQTLPEGYDATLPAGYDGSYESNVVLSLAINEQVQQCTPIEVTGDLNSMYEDTNDFKKTITETIGQVNGENGFSKQIDLLTGKTDNNVYTVSEALTTLSTQLYSTKSANDNLQNLVASLIKRIEALESTND